MSFPQSAVKAQTTQGFAQKSALFTAEREIFYITGFRSTLIKSIRLLSTYLIGINYYFNIEYFQRHG